MIKIAYLHGLESNNLGPKNDWLRQISAVYDPFINYYESHIYQKLHLKIRAFKPDLLIGSSMGGYFAYEMAKNLNIKAVLFNPALHSRSMNPDITGHTSGQFFPKMQFILGANDPIIDSEKTIIILKNQGLQNFETKILDHEHGTPFDLFAQEITCFLDQNF